MSRALSHIRLWCVLCALVPCISLQAADEQASLAQPDTPKAGRSNSELFLSAQAAYDDGRYAEAAELYGILADDGVTNVELDYNRANALFKNRELPGAVLHYRRAWYKAPRDPDIRANLHFALNAAGASEAAPSLYARFFTMFSRSEWIIVAVAGYILLILLLMLCMLIRPARRLLLRSCILPAVTLLLSVGGWRYWQQLEAYPEWVVIRTGATALFGPIDGTTAHYKVPRGALVRQHASDPKGWIEIEYDGKKGWLKSPYIERVYP